MNAGRPRPRRRLEREVHQCLPEDDGLRSAHGRGGPGSRPRRRPSRRCSKRRPLVVELGEVAGEGRILERPDPSSLASRRRAVGVGRSSVAADTRAAAGGGRRGGPRSRSAEDRRPVAPRLPRPGVDRRGAREARDDGPGAGAGSRRATAWRPRRATDCPSAAASSGRRPSASAPRRSGVNYRLGYSLSVLQGDVDAGMVAGVTGTPTVFINGRSVTGARPFEAYQRIIEAELWHGQPRLGDSGAGGSLRDVARTRARV